MVWAPLQPRLRMTSAALPVKAAYLTDFTSCARCTASVDLPVAAQHGTDPGGSARHDQIAGPQGNELAEIGDGLADAPDLVGEVAGLAHAAIDRERDSALVRMADAAGRLDRANRRRKVEALGHF